MGQELTAAALRRSRRDPDSFAIFYSHHVESLLAFIARRVYDPDTAWDLAAESFARAYLKRWSFRGHTDAEAAAWLFTIARREILQYQRRDRIEQGALKRMGLDSPTLTEEEEARVLELASIEDFRDTVRAQLDRLDSAQRDALNLRVVEELSYEEVAFRLGISEQTARARVSRGLRRLRNSLEVEETAFIEGGKE